MTYEKVVVVCGSRGFKDGEFLRNTIVAKYGDDAERGLILFRYGDAEGADTIIHELCVFYGWKHEKPWVPDWQRHKGRAGLVRNIDMLDANPNATDVEGFYDGKRTKGTFHTVTEARKRKLNVTEHGLEVDKERELW